MRWQMALSSTVQASALYASALDSSRTCSGGVTSVTSAHKAAAHSATQEWC
jgi:hypothetical protein